MKHAHFMATVQTAASAARALKDEGFAEMLVGLAGCLPEKEDVTRITVETVLSDNIRRWTAATSEGGAVELEKAVASARKAGETFFNILTGPR